jgi:hypothetical protein
VLAASAAAWLTAIGSIAGRLPVEDLVYYRRRTFQQRPPRRERSGNNRVVHEIPQLLLDVWSLEDEDNLRVTEIDGVAYQPELARVIGRSGTHNFSCSRMAAQLELRSDDNSLHASIVRIDDRRGQAKVAGGGRMIARSA